MTLHRISETLGFTWICPPLPSQPPGSSRRAQFRYRQSLVEFVYDASRLEGNPFTFPEVKTLMDGITVGGHRLHDSRQVLNLAAAAQHLIDRVEAGCFRLEKGVSDELHARTAREEALEWGHFRGQGEETSLTPEVHLGKGTHVPLATSPGGENLLTVHEDGLVALAEVAHPLERGMAYFLFAALQQFYFDGNKRTGRFMMNGELMTHGWDAISVPASRALEFNGEMVWFYRERDGSRMMEFLYGCRSGRRSGSEEL